MTGHEDPDIIMKQKGLEPNRTSCQIMLCPEVTARHNMPANLHVCSLPDRGGESPPTGFVGGSAVCPLRCSITPSCHRL